MISYQKNIILFISFLSLYPHKHKAHNTTSTNPLKHSFFLLLKPLAHKAAHFPFSLQKKKKETSFPFASSLISTSSSSMDTAQWPQVFRIHNSFLICILQSFFFCIISWIRVLNFVILFRKMMVSQLYL